MKILFVVPPAFVGVGPSRRPEVVTPLGLLSLASVAEAEGHSVEILDFSLLIRDEGWSWDDDDLSSAAIEILARGPEVVGLTTLTGTYPLTLRLVQAVRRRDARVPILLGGPQASTVDHATLRAFPEVTGIVRGEAEGVLSMVLEWCAGKRDAAAVPGLTFRRGGETVRNVDAPLIDDLDTLPEPAWHLYPIEKVVPLFIDAGRGCPFECTFCTTNTFFRRRYRVKSPARLIAECESLMRRTGERRFFFVHDLFTVNRRKVVETCEAIIRSGIDIEWRTSARVDLVDEELLTLLSRSGCRNLFFGLESGSEEMQREIKKRIKVRDVVPKLAASLRLGIEPTASFIIGFPDESLEDLWATARMALALVRAGIGDLYIHNLLPLPDAPITRQHQEELVFQDRPAFLLPISRADWELVKQHPEVFFSFHTFPRRGPWVVRQLMMRGADLVRAVHARRGKSFVRSGPTQPLAEAAAPVLAPAPRPVRRLPLAPDAGPR